ncbi:MAG: hypothetical protein WCI77_07755 [Candidatus Omnitrophota bacterium]
MRLGNKIGLLIIIIIPVWIFIRAQLIYTEGPKIVKRIEEYKVRYKTYPETLGQMNIRSILSPIYMYSKNDDKFSLMYSIFIFSRWYYDSNDKKWKTMD